MARPPKALFLISLVAVAALGGYLALREAPSGTQPCLQYYDDGIPLRHQLSVLAAGQRSTFILPSPPRDPNGVIVASDGSIWFGEEALPAFGHLFLNGTLVEYPWPGTYPPPGTNYSCGYRTQIWGIALWNGSVWASDAAGNQLMGMDVKSGTFETVMMGSPSAFPYFVGAGPDGDLWFTTLSDPAIGKLDQNGSLQTYSLPTGINGTPTQIKFVNSSYAAYSDAGVAGENNGGVFSFDPAHPSFIRLGGTRPLGGLTGLALLDSGFWVSQHGPAYIDYFDYGSETWTDYPTSTVSYAQTTLPYFLASDGERIWFNEHDGDRMAQIDPATGTMVEYSLSSPPASSLSGISSTLTIAGSKDGVWYTQVSRNAVGLMNFTEPPPFSLSSLSNSSLILSPGESSGLSFKVTGTSESLLQVRFSDTEDSTGVNSNLTASASPAQVHPGEGFSATISASSGAPAGRYTFAVSVSDGSTTSTVFLKVTVP